MTWKGPPACSGSTELKTKGRSSFGKLRVHYERQEPASLASIWLKYATHLQTTIYLNTPSPKGERHGEFTGTNKLYIIRLKWVKVESRKGSFRPTAILEIRISTGLMTHT